MELRHLRYFIAAADTENVSKAAGRLHLSQPALSRQIRDLEEELGFALFERTAKSVRLTDAGRSFLTTARAVLEQVDAGVSVARAVAKDNRAELHVGYAPSPTARIMPAALRAFQAQFPIVRVKLHDLSTEEMLERVREGKLQLALLVRPSRNLLRGLHFEELARDTMCVAVPPDHALARLASVSVKQAAGEPLVIFSPKDYPEYIEYLDELFSSIKPKPRIAEEHDSSASLIAAIESGAGVAIVPNSFSCSAGLRLKLIPLSPAPAPIIIGAIWSKGSRSSIAQNFANSAKAAASAIEQSRSA